RLLSHVHPAIKLIARIQKLRVIAISNQLLELSRAQPVFAEIAQIELKTFTLHELFGFAACGAIRLLKKLDSLFPLQPTRHFRLCRTHFCLPIRPWRLPRADSS